MKSIEIEFPAGTEVVVMLNNNFVATKIRAVRYSESVEIRRDPAGLQFEQVNTTLLYSTFASPNRALCAKDIALTKEELMQKKFSN